MCRFKSRFGLSALAVSVSISFFLSASLAQPAATDPETAPAVAAQPPRTVGADFIPTAEDKGDVLMLHQRYQAAIEAYRSSPDSSQVWNKMGIAHQLMYNLPEAIRCYQASLKLDPRNANVLNNLGTIYNSLRDYSQAERSYRKAIALAPRDALVYRNLGTTLLSQHKFKEGWEAYKTALDLDPNIFQGRTGPSIDNPGSAQDRGAMNYYMARGCVRAGMNDCAIDYLRRALNEGFTNPKKIVADSEFAGLRGVPAFDRLLAAQEQR